MAERKKPTRKAAKRKAKPRKKAAAKKPAARVGISPAAYAKRIDVSRQAVMALMDKGLIAKSVWKERGRWKIDPDEADKERARNAQLRRDVPAAEQIPREQLDAADGRAPRMTLVEAKTLTEESKAELERIKLQELQGQLVRAEVVERERFNHARMLRDAVLALPARISPELAAITDAKELAIFLERKLVQALEDLVEGHIGGAA